MIIRQVYGKTTKAVAKLRQWTQTPTGCKGCDKTRQTVGVVIGAKPKDRRIP